MTQERIDLLDKLEFERDAYWEKWNAKKYLELAKFYEKYGLVTQAGCHGFSKHLLTWVAAHCQYK